jgi:hypothetical protein
MSGRDSPNIPKSLFERHLDSIGLDKIDSVGPIKVNSLLWFAAIIFFVEVVVLQAYNVAVGRQIGFVENPLRLLDLLILFYTAAAVQFIRRRYGKAVEQSRIIERTNTFDGNHSLFEQFTPDRLVLILTILGTTFGLLNAVFLLTIPQIYDIGGPARVIRFCILIPFGYTPILASGLASYGTAEVLIPRRIRNSDVSLDYHDPENLGGVRPIGEFVKTSYYVGVVALIAYAFSVYGPHIVGGPLVYNEIEPPDVITNIAFTFVWALSVGALGYGIYVLHRFMREEKKEDLLEVKKEMENFQNHYNIKEFTTADPPKEWAEHKETSKLIASTREYPAKFTMWVQLFIGVFLPKAVQIILSSI